MKVTEKNPLQSETIREKSAPELLNLTDENPLQSFSIRERFSENFSQKKKERVSCEL